MRLKVHSTVGLTIPAGAFVHAGALLLKQAPAAVFRSALCIGMFNRGGGRKEGGLTLQPQRSSGN